jgi:hypothetical protein
LPEPRALRLVARLSGHGYDIDNVWDFNVFPALAPKPVTGVWADEEVFKIYSRMLPGIQAGSPEGANGLILTSQITSNLLGHLAGGGDAILLGAGGLPSRTTSFYINPGGRVAGNVATVIADHPLANRLPHDGWCGWTFVNMMNGEVVVFNGLNWPFDPIVDVASSYKQMFKQSNLFEYRIAKGRLLGCTFNLRTSDPAAMFLLESMVDYARSRAFRPAQALSVRDLAQGAGCTVQASEDSKQDHNFDYRARQN